MHGDGKSTFGLSFKMEFGKGQLYSHFDKNSGERFEDMFLVKIASKGTSLNSIHWTLNKFFILKSAESEWPS